MDHSRNLLVASDWLTGALRVIVVAVPVTLAVCFAGLIYIIGLPLDRGRRQYAERAARCFLRAALRLVGLAGNQEAADGNSQDPAPSDLRKLRRDHNRTVVPMRPSTGELPPP